MRQGRERLRVWLWGGSVAGLVAVAATAGNYEDLWPVTNTGALLAAGCGVVLAARWVRSRLPRRAALAADVMRAQRTARMARENTDRLHGHDRQLRECDARISGLYGMMQRLCDDAGITAPDLEATMPILRAVRDRAG